ncbi:MAG: aquaporin [Parachlamydiaceae bacterium]|nr:aquaporin [Parachlamydiaceae bacterium]
MKYVYEFIGTFFLMLTVGMTVLATNNAALWAPFAIGSVMAVMVFAGGHISGGHYNPAISLAAFLRKKLDLNDLLRYWAVQFAACVAAALIVILFKGAPAESPIELNAMKILLMEFLFTFALCFVMLNVSTTNATAGNSYFGWAIGFTVLVGAYAIGPISSAALNPAVALGLSILNLNYWSNLLIYIVGSLLGGGAAALVVNAAHPGENGMIFGRNNLFESDKKKQQHKNK